MKTILNHGRRSRAGFSTVELVVAIVLFSMASSGVLYMGKAMRDNRTASVSSSQQNAYATFQSQVALQGINPALVGNPMASSINQLGSAGSSISLGTNTALRLVRAKQAQFEVGAVVQPGGAQRSLGGSARVDAINYTVSAAGAQGERGAGVGFGVETSGPAAPVNAIPLAPPSFNFLPDLTTVPFPINNIATLPSSNPPGTTYRYTTDGSVPTAGSAPWNNNPGWTPSTFPGQVTIAAFNSDPQYATSVPVSTTFSMTLQVSYSRADGRVAGVYGFTLPDLAVPSATGIVLTTNVPGFEAQYTLDGSNPAVAGSLYNGAFVPAQAQFTPNVTLLAVAISNDPRILSSNIVSFPLSTETAPLSPPNFVTSNAAPLSPGTPVVISVSGSAAPRTEVNNGAPSTSSSSATSFPIN